MTNLSMKYNPAFLDDETLVHTFVVRHQEFESVLEVIHENTGEANQHLLVIGPRGSGKSTLVLRVAAEIRRTPELSTLWYPVIFGEESYLVTDAGEFWLEALLQIAEQTGEDRWHKAHNELQSERDTDRLTRRALAQLMDFADEQDKRLVLIVENLNMLVGAQLDDDDAWALRKVLQNESRLMLLGTATRRFDQIDNEQQALYEFFRIIELDPLDSLDDIGQLWALAAGDETPRSYLRPVEILTGGNPRLIRILSEFAARTSFRELMENLVHLMDEHTEYFKHHLDSLAPMERKVFVALADRWDPSTARDVAEAARMDVNATSAQLKRLEQRGAVVVHDQRGRTKVYRVAERLYNVYHLMRRRGQASARVRAAVRFMVHLYEGDRLLPAVQSLVSEACALAPEQRRDHYLAYSEVLNWVGPELRTRILAETREQIESLPDLPDDLRDRLRESNPYLSLSSEEIVDTDLEAISTPERLNQLGGALASLYLDEPADELLEMLLAVNHQYISLRPDDPIAYHNLGVTLSELGHVAEAIDAYDYAIKLEPEYLAAHHNRGILFSELGRHREALAAYDRVLEIKPDYVSAYNNRGNALSNLGRYEEALADYDRAINLRPDDAEAYYNQAVTLDDVGRYAEALKALDNALELRPNDADTYVMRGVVFVRLKRYEEALLDFERATEINPLDALSHVNRGSMLAELERYKEAFEAFNRALELQPNRVDAQVNRGVALIQLKRYDEALHLLSAVTATADHIPLVVHLALMLAVHRQTEPTLQALASSSIASEVEPLIVALKMDLGEQVDVALEIEEVAKDMLASIRSRRSALADEDQPITERAPLRSQT